jgi:hypothetical protein
MVILLDREHLESPLPNVATAVVMLVVPANERILQPVHPPAQFAIFLRPDDQVKMVGHQAIGRHTHRTSRATHWHQRTLALRLRRQGRTIQPDLAVITIDGKKSLTFIGTSFLLPDFAIRERVSLFRSTHRGSVTQGHVIGIVRAVKAVVPRIVRVDVPGRYVDHR